MEMKMKRSLIVVFLLLCALTTLANAGFFSPKPPSTTVLNEGQETVKVKLEKDDGNTKVFISPQDGDVRAHASAGEDERDVEETTTSSHARFSPKELVCDAYGKCKHKVASAFGQTKDAVEDTADGTAEKAGEAKDAVSQTTGKVSGKARTASDKAKDVSEAAVKGTYGKVKDTADVTAETAGKVSGKARTATDKAVDMSEAAVKGTYGKVKDTAYDAAHGAKETAGEAAEKAKHGAEKGTKGFMWVFRRTARVVSYLVPWKTMASASGVIHLLGFSVAYGTSLWVTFASGYVLAAALPRTQFAMVQSKIYPLYFKAMGSSIGLAMLGHLLGPRRMFSVVSMAALGASLLMTLANSLYLEPRATKVMFERMKKEKEEGSALRQREEEETVKTPTTAEGLETKRAEGATPAKGSAGGGGDGLRQLNSYSSMLNVATLVALTWHLVYLGKNLHSVC